jgi:hypothetical protein
MLEDQRLFAQTAPKLYCSYLALAMLASFPPTKWLYERKMYLM